MYMGTNCSPKTSAYIKYDLRGRAGRRKMERTGGVDGKMNKAKAIILSIAIFISAALIVMFAVDFNQPYNPYFSIENAKIMMGQKDLLTVFIKDKEYHVKPDVNFLQLFNDKEWKEVKVKDGPESKPSLSIIIQDNEYELVFYSDEFLASINYYDKAKANMKWYKVPFDTCIIIENYIKQQK